MKAIKIILLIIIELYWNEIVNMDYYILSFIMAIILQCLKNLSIGIIPITMLLINN